MFTIYSPLLIVQCRVYCLLMPGTDIYKKLLHDKMNHNDCHLMLSLLCFKKRPAYSLHKAPRNEWIVCTAFDCTISKKIKVIQNNRSDTLYCFAKHLKSSKNCNCHNKYAFTTAYFCIMKQKKMKQTNWTQMLNRKSTNTPLIQLIFVCTLTLKRVCSEFLETQLRSSKGVFALFLLSIRVQFVCFMLSNLR